MKSEEQIQKEIEALKIIRPNVRSRSMFGDDNLAALDAQIEVLEGNLDDGDIYDRYDRTSSSEYILNAAFDARQWIDDDDCEGLACGWPLKE